MLQTHDREIEPALDLLEDGFCRAEARIRGLGVAAQGGSTRAVACAERAQVRRVVTRRQLLDQTEQAVDGLLVAERERGSECCGERELHRVVRQAELRAVGERVPGDGERVTGVAAREQHARLHGPRARAELDLVRIDVAADGLEPPLRLGELAALEEDRNVQEADEADERVVGEALLRDLLLFGERAVPVAEIDEHSARPARELHDPRAIADPMGDLRGGARMLERHPVAVASLLLGEQVVVGAQRGVPEPVLERDREAVAEQDGRLDVPPARSEHDALRVQPVGQHLRELERLGDLEGELVPLHRLVGAPGEEERTGELDSEHREVRAALLLHENRERPLHLGDRALHVHLLPEHDPELRGDAGRPFRQAERLVATARLLEVLLGGLRATGEPGCRARLLMQLRLGERAVGERERALEVRLRALVRGQ